jgi:predicted permease
MTMSDDPSGGREGRHPARRLLAAKPQAEVDEELAFHLEQRVREYIARGMDPDAARAAAMERFGDLAGVRSEYAQMLAEDRRAERRRDWLDDLRQDLRFGVRSALRSPLFSLVAVLTLALGIGANAAVFGVVKSVMLDALPYPDAGRLMRIYTPIRNQAELHGSVSPGTVSDLRERQRSFARIGAFMPARDVVFTGDQGPRVLKAIWAEPDFFATLGLRPTLGRAFTEEDAAHDTALVVLLPNATWRRTFGDDPDIVGKKLLVNGIPRTVAGVLPRDFVVPGETDPTDFYFPLSIAPSLRDPVGVRGSHWLGLVGRLRAGVPPETAERELAAIGTELERAFPKDNNGFAMMGLPLRDDMVGDTRTPLLVLMASAGLVLLITCANLAGALLSRTISRRKEFAVRVALGAGRGRLARQLLTESTVLALVGGAAGLALAALGLRVLRGVALQALPPYADLSLDAGAIAVTFLLALLTGLAFGVAPALSVGRADPQGTLREEGRGSSESRRSRRLRGVLVAGQIALCVSLLAAAGLLARSLWAMTAAPLGFDADGLLSVTVPLPANEYATNEARVRLHDQLAERLGALPGVSGVAVMRALPTTVDNSNGFFIQGSPWASGSTVPFILTSRVSEDYFRTMGTPLKRGRVFATTDRAGGPPVAVINEAMAKRYWPRGDAIGAHIRMGPDPTAPWKEIVGIVGDVRNDPARPAPDPMIYLSNRQEPWGDMYAIRTHGDPLALVAAVRREVAALDPKLPMYKVATVRSMLDDRLTSRRLPVVLMTAFGALALVLASVGVYAMFANMAAAREREFGVRVALGSSRGAIAALVLRQGGAWMALGLALGALGVLAVTRAVGGLLYGVSRFDPIALGLAALLLLACGTVALLVPVRRATRADPISVLR